MDWTKFKYTVIERTSHGSYRVFACEEIIREYKISTSLTYKKCSEVVILNSTLGDRLNTQQSIITISNKDLRDQRPLNKPMVSSDKGELFLKLYTKAVEMNSKVTSLYEGLNSLLTKNINNEDSTIKSK